MQEITLMFKKLAACMHTNLACPITSRFHEKHEFSAKWDLSSNIRFANFR